MNMTAEGEGKKGIMSSDQDDNKSGGGGGATFTRTRLFISRVLGCTKRGICPSWGFSNPLKYYRPVIIVALIPLD